MRSCLLLLLALPLMAAAPPRQLTLTLPADGIAAPPAANAPATSSRFEPAPLPNRGVDGPVVARASNQPSLAPTLFSNKEHYRGDGFSPGSTAQSEQERNVKPSVGFKLRMPFTPD